KGLERAKLRAAEAHTVTAREQAQRGLYKEALDEYRLALDLKPDSPTLWTEMQDVESRRQAGTEAASMEQIKARSRETALPGPARAVGADAQMPLGLVFRGSSLKDAYQALGRVVGVNFVFDPQFQDQTISLDLKEVPFDQALNALASVGHTFHRVVDSRIVTVI